MKKMLKIIAMLLVIATVVFAAGCSSKEAENKSVAAEDVAESAATAEVTADTTATEETTGEETTEEAAADVTVVKNVTDDEITDVSIDLDMAEEPVDNETEGNFTAEPLDGEAANNS
jgi:predicted component of type VI protein secretion system